MELELETGINFLSLSIEEPDFAENEEWLEIYYRQEGSEGWGAGGGEYITRHDLSVIADGFRSVLNGDKDIFEYECGVTEHIYEEYRNPILKIFLTSKKMSLSMIETLERKTYITVEGTDVSDYASIFYDWENELCKKTKNP